MPKLVVRGGVGLFYNAYENEGYAPNIGENYPFVFNFNYTPQVPTGSTASSVAPVSYLTPYAGCATAGPGGTATLNSGFSCIGLTPLNVVNAQGLGLQGRQFNFITPRTLSTNLTFQYALTHTLSAQVAYVFTDGMDLEIFPGINNVTAILPSGSSTTISPSLGGVAYPGFRAGLELRKDGRTQQLQWPANQVGTAVLQRAKLPCHLYMVKGAVGCPRPAQWRQHWQVTARRRCPALAPVSIGRLAPADIRNVFHFSGGYNLPIGKDQKFLHDVNGLENAIVGGWSINWIVTAQGGQPDHSGLPDYDSRRDKL